MSMRNGKKICAHLKVVRKQIADANDIPYEITECPHQGPCAGTCPKCESELRYIENQLSLRRAAGKAVSLVGLSLGISSAFAAQGVNNDTIAIHTDTVYLNSIPEDAIEGSIVADPCYTIVDQMPEFPGGETALMDYIKQNLRYPAMAGEIGLQGRVTLTFVIETDGTISYIDILRSPAEELSQEAIRLVKAMPKWTPGKIKDTPVRVKYVLPITFKIES